MTGKDLMLAMGDIDERYIEEAEPSPRISCRSGWDHFPFCALRLAAVAASLIIAIAAFTLFANGHRYEAGGNGGSHLQSPGNAGLSGVPGQSGAIYHDLEPSQIISRPIEAKVPAEFWFEIRLCRAQLNRTGFLARWDEESLFTKADIESGLQAPVEEPALPEGDYTTVESVLRDARTDEIIAYRIEYIYFDPQSLDFIKSFGLYYFDPERFDRGKITGTQWVNLQNGEPRVDEFVPPVEAHDKVPHVRSLVFLDSGIGIALEAQSRAYFEAEGNAIDQERSLKFYKMTDQELVEMMRSLIGKMQLDR